MKSKEKLALSFLTVCIVLLAIYYGYNKVNYYSDEVWTFGLANHITGIYPDIEKGIKYTQYGPFENFVKVNEQSRFNYVNTWKNQIYDVHPPFYYLLVNTVCSLFPDTYSKWYGIAINLFWIFLIIPLLYKLTKSITGNYICAFGITAAYGLSVVCMDTLIFIRMYTQFTFFTISISYLIKQYYAKTFDRKFYILLSANFILGMLTHYYFLIYYFALCLCTICKLHIQNRKNELKKLLKTIFGSVILYTIIWPYFWIHLFLRHRGQQAIYHAIIPKNLITGPLMMLSESNYEAFAGIGSVFIILGIILLIIKIRKKESLIGFKTSLFLAALFYLIVVGTIAPFMDIRYIMSIIWIFILSAYIILRSLIIRIKHNLISEYVVLIAFLIIDLINHILFGWKVPNDYYYPETIEIMKDMENYETVVYLDEEWKPIIFFEELQHSKGYIFVDDTNAKRVLESMNEDYYLLTCVEEEAEELITQNIEAELMYYRAGRGYYFVKKGE